jgi:hypothetical protein
VVGAIMTATGFFPAARSMVARAEFRMTDAAGTGGGVRKPPKTAGGGTSERLGLSMTHLNTDPRGHIGVCSQ